MDSQKRRLFTNKIGCAKCSKPLSVAPILFFENVGTFCGRCPPPKGLGKGVHVTIYEEMASRFSFPCCYERKGCTFMGLFNGMREHEETCGKMEIKCPFGKQCAHTLDKTVKHWKERHAESILSKTVFNCHVNKESFRMYFLAEANLMIRLRPVGEDLLLNVGFIGAASQQFQSFNVTVMTWDGNQSFSFENQPFTKYLAEENSENGTSVCIKKGSLELLTDKSSFLRFVIGLVLKEENGNKTCLICANKLDAEVKLCQNGHVSCGQCAVKSLECALCKEKLVSPQKPTFYVNLNNQITYDCPLRERGKCNFNGTTGTILTHFLNVHKDVYKKEPKHTITLTKDQTICTRIFFYCFRKLFIFEGDYKARRITINTVVFNDLLEDKKYRFKVELKNDNNNYEFTEEVIPINQIKEGTSVAALDLTEFMLRPFIRRESITFSFSLLKD